ncbi:MAG: DUF1848 family protein, partial [Armatimonadota bacterium]
DPHQRKACRCVVSKDIGWYNTCLFGCQYCYATRSSDKQRRLIERQLFFPENHGYNQSRCYNFSEKPRST